ncbi:MAG: exodeoxyribonuclease V subunit alpha, partial [Candidatus Binatia bacterium]
MMPTLETLRSAGVLSPLDEHFASTLARLGREERPEVLLAAALVAGRVGDGHVCLDLGEVGGEPVRGPEGVAELEGCRWPALDEWLDALGRSPLAAPGGPAPLVLEGTRLYLRRYHEHETELARRILARARRRDVRVDRERLRDGCRRLFPDGRRNPDWQRVAATLAVCRRLTVISGGPGTGKTWTVARILALLVEQGIAIHGRPPRLHLLAPTGKAASRLRESIRESRGGLAVEESVRAAIPDETATIHRALGVGGDGGFRHGADRPLVTDAVIVDEASMVDLALMSALFAAIPADARVILLGDRDQLASVEAGSVLADLCGEAPEESVSAETAALVADCGGEEVPRSATAAPEIRDAVVRLRESRRFRERPGIGALAEAVRTADAGAALEALSGSFSDVSLDASGPPLAERLAPLAARGYEPYLRRSSHEERLEAFGAFRILCAHRRGPAGIEALNPLVEATLAACRLLDLSDASYVHRPLLVTRNDPAIGLFNGDIGIVVRDGTGKKALFP